MGDFIKLAQDRYSVRKLSNAPVEKKKIDAIIKAGMLAPTAVNKQPVKLWVISSDENREKALSTIPFPFVHEAPVLIVVGGKPDEAWVRPYDGKNFNEVDATIVATHIMLEIHDLGLGSTWIGKFDAPKMKELFPEMANYNLIAIFPVAYPAEGARPSIRHEESKDLSDMVEEL